jgi:uncharacterized membrane protein YbaN (DUF454 family)
MGTSMSNTESLTATPPGLDGPVIDRRIAPAPVLPSQDFSAQVHPTRCAVMRPLYIAGGVLCVGLGVVGIFLPILPTTPFMLLAAYLFSRASARFYNALLNNRYVGPGVRAWKETGAIPLRAKIMAVVLIVASIGSTIIFVADTAVMRGILLGVLLLVLWIQYRIPTRR